MKIDRCSALRRLMLISALGYNSVWAQVQASVGVQAGVNIANASFTSSMTGVSGSARTGLLIGGIVALSIPGDVRFRAEPMYVQNGATVSIELGQGLSYKEIYELEYIEFPVHVMLQFLSGPLRPYIFGGPNLGIVIAANLEEEMPPGVGGEPEFRQSGTRDIKNEISSSNFSIDLGGGVAYEVASQIQ
ncbi:MAG: PorT family protein, partial [Bacteroidetes bacterium]|nr:PorT family protein [Bacteroidota bacterium]